nr:hypothetical protein [Tanacetum cinerariifolium]
MNEVYYYGQNSCYDSTSIGFDQPQPSQSPVIHQPPQELSIQEMEDLKHQYLDELKRLSNLEYRDEIKIAELTENFNGMSIEIRKKEKLLQQEQWAYLSTHPSKRLHSFYFDDDEEDYTSTITPNEPFLSTEEPNNSLNDVLREKLLNVNLLISKIEALNVNPTPPSGCKTKSSSTSLNSLLEETNIFDNSLPKFETFCFNVEEISSGSTTTPPDISLLEYETFHDDHVKEISSSSPTTHSDSSLYASFMFDLSINPFPLADRSNSYELTDELIPFISPSEYDCFLFKVEPNSRDFTKDVVENISLTKEPQVLNTLPTHLTLQLNMKFHPSSESLFAYVVWIFLPFLVYSVAPYYLLSLRTEDIIFYPGICKSTFSRPDISHRCGTIKKFNTHRSHLNKCPMLIHGQNNPLLDVLLFYFHPP